MKKKKRSSGRKEFIFFKIKYLERNKKKNYALMNIDLSNPLWRIFFKNVWMCRSGFLRSYITRISRVIYTRVTKNYILLVYIYHFVVTFKKVHTSLSKYIVKVSFSINIANFEAFLSVLKLTKNPLFLKSGLFILFNHSYTRILYDTNFYNNIFEIKQFLYHKKVSNKSWIGQ